MNELTLFNNPDFGTVRAIEIDGSAWLVGKEIAEKLGYSNATKAIQVHVDEEDKKKLDFKGFSHFVIGLWGENDFSDKVLINESGLYSLVMSSKMPNAKKFRRWITSEVIPSIMRTGSYSIEQKPTSQLDLLQGMLDVMKQTEARVTAIETAQAEQQNQLDKVKDAFEITTKTWRTEANKLVKKIAKESGTLFQQVWIESYKALETKAGCNLRTRMEHKKERMYNNGATATQLRQISTLDVIAEDEKLIQHYISVLREMAFKN